MFVAPLLVVTFILTLGLSLLLSALNVRYRDVSQALPFVLQLWFFLSPVAFALLTPAHAWETYLQALNPLVGIIEAFRWALLGTPPPHGLVPRRRDRDVHVLRSRARVLLAGRSDDRGRRVMADPVISVRDLEKRYRVWTHAPPTNLKERVRIAGAPFVPAPVSASASSSVRTCGRSAASRSTFNVARCWA